MESPNEKQMFGSDWTNSTFFVQVKEGAYCLLCPDSQKKFKSTKKFAFERHFQKKHSEIYEKSVESRNEILTNILRNLKSKYSKEIKHYIEKRKRVSEYEKNAKISNLVVAHKIAKRSRPFEEGAFIKECLGDVVSLLCPEMSVRLNELTLSRRTIGRKIVQINDYLITRLKDLLNNAKLYSICLDESVDIKDISQLCFFIRGINKQFDIFEEFLSIRPMRDRTTGKDIFDEFMKCKSEFNIDFMKLFSVTTDGCPSMTGKNVEFVKLLSEEIKKQCPNREIIPIHCIIHQEDLSKNSLKLDNVTSVVNKFVNFVRGSSLRHRQFNAFLKNKRAEYIDVFHHHQVRWLSIGEVVLRVYNLRKYIVEYLKEIGNMEYPQFECNEWLANCAFAVDILGLLNRLNKKLQGKNKLAFNMYSDLKNFVIELPVLLNSTNIDKFPILSKHKDLITEEQLNSYSAVLRNLFDDLNTRFQDFRSIDFMFRCTYELLDVNFDSETCALPVPRYQAMAIEQYKMIQNNEELRQNYETMSHVEFFKSLKASFDVRHVNFFSALCFVIFGSTYNCESLFSSMQLNKSSIRSNLNDASLDAIMRICSSNAPIDFEQIVNEST